MYLCIFTWKREGIQGANMLYLIDKFQCKVQLDFAGKEFKIGWKSTTSLFSGKTVVLKQPEDDNQLLAFCGFS